MARLARNECPEREGGPSFRSFLFFENAGKRLLSRRCAVASALMGVLLCGGGLLAAGCEYRATSGTEKTIQQEKKRATAPDQITEDARFFIYENDRPRALVEAARMERYETEDSTYTLLRDPGPPPDSSRSDSSRADSSRSDTTAGRVIARIFSRGKEARDDAQPEEGVRRKRDSVSATIRANRIVYHDEDRRFDARGRVIVTTPGGKHLESEHLVWLEDERRITAPDFVSITTPTDRIQGYRLRADENLDTYQLGRVTGQVTVEKTP
jgi:hypothetical protein